MDPQWYCTHILRNRDSVGTNSLPPLSFGVSEAGGGPIAIAAAGQAVAVVSSRLQAGGPFERMICLFDMAWA